MPWKKIELIDDNNDNNCNYADAVNTEVKKEPTEKMVEADKLPINEMGETGGDKPRRPRWERTAPQWYENYKLYVTAAQEDRADHFVFTTINEDNGMVHAWVAQKNVTF